MKKVFDPIDYVLPAAIAVLTFTLLTSKPKCLKV